MPKRYIDSSNPIDLLTTEQQSKLLQSLNELISEQRQQLIANRAAMRTRHITLVLEDIFQSHNASAVVRSCDCFGVQDIHVVEQRNSYSMNPEIAMGSNKWVDYYSHSSIEETYDYLKHKGYSIVATTPHTNDTTIDQLPVDQPLAMVFGTELTGLSTQAIDLADAFVKIPMYGFTESFNISVSAAICLYDTTERMRRSGIRWQLSTDEQLNLQLHWTVETIRNGQKVAEELIKSLF